MMRPARLLASRGGSAAAEMALVAPLLCAILLGSVELGSYFYNEHILKKAVRDGARYAARQSFTLYTCTGAPGDTVVADTQALVRTSLLSGGSDRFSDIQNSDITLTTTCQTTVSSQSMVNGIYKGMTTGAPVVEVSATVDYSPVIGTAFGFSGVGFHMNATEQAAVMGI